VIHTVMPINLGVGYPQRAFHPQAAWLRRGGLAAVSASSR